MKKYRMTELTPEQQRNLDAIVGAVQRIAMHIVTLPKNQRAEQYAAVRRTFEESIQEFGVEDETADKWLDGTLCNRELAPHATRANDCSWRTTRPTN
jgi:hypothetical protein